MAANGKKGRKAAQRSREAAAHPRLEGEARLLGRPLEGASAATPQPERAVSRQTEPGKTPTKKPSHSRKPSGKKRSAPPRRRSRGERLRKIIRHKQWKERRFRIFAVLLYLLCGLLAAASFFPIETVEVRGVTHYPRTDILETFGIQPGDNLFFCRSFSGAKRLKEQYPYFESVKVKRNPPNKLVVEVVETEPIAAIQNTAGGYFLIDSKARVLEDAVAPGTVAPINGFFLEEAEVGKNISNEVDGRIATLKILLETLETTGILEQITGYCLNDPSDLYICYQDRVAVRLGTVDLLEQKLYDMIVLLENNLSPTDYKQLDLTGLPTIRLIPSDDEEVARIMRGEFSRAQEGNLPTAKKEKM